MGGDGAREKMLWGASQERRSTGAKGAAYPLSSKAGDKKGKSAPLMLSVDLVFSHFLLTFILLAGSISFYPQDFHDFPRNATMVGIICL